MSTTFRRLKSAQARIAAEWIGITNDLKNSISCFEIWSKFVQNGSVTEDGEVSGADAMVQSSLFKNGVMSFYACFEDNEHVHLTFDEVYGDTKGAVEYFEWITELRHSWAAHRFGPARQAYVALEIDDDTGDLIGGQNAGMSIVSPHQSVAPTLIQFVTQAHDYADTRRVEEIDKVREEALALHPNQRLKLPEVELTQPTLQQLRMGRRKYANVADPKSQIRMDGWKKRHPNEG